jgi:hypothetical protein
MNQYKRFLHNINVATITLLSVIFAVLPGVVTGATISSELTAAVSMPVTSADVKCFPSLSTDFKLTIPILVFQEPQKTWYLQVEFDGSILPKVEVKWSFQLTHFEVLNSSTFSTIPTKEKAECYANLRVLDNGAYFIHIPKLYYGNQILTMDLQETLVGMLVFDVVKGPELVSPLNNPGETIGETVDKEQVNSLTDQITALLVEVNKKKQLDVVDVDNLEKAVDELGANLPSQVMMAFTLTQSSALENTKSSSPSLVAGDTLSAFENLMAEIGQKVQAIEALMEYTMVTQVQTGEILLGKELVDFTLDQDLRNALGEDGLRSHVSAGLISLERAQKIKELPIQSEPSVDSCLTPSPVSFLFNNFMGNILDVFVSKAEAKVALPCISLCKNGVTQACIGCILKQLPAAYTCYTTFISEWNSCPTSPNWKKVLCRAKALAKFIVCLA